MGIVFHGKGKTQLVKLCIFYACFEAKHDFKNNHFVGPFVYEFKNV